MSRASTAPSASAPTPTATVPDVPDAVALVNDLVRVCILLASHAPVNQVIAGALHEPATIRPGGLLKLAIDPAYVRVGMPVAGPQRWMSKKTAGMSV